MSKEMQFEFDPEALIEEVKKRPGLWDHESLEYRSKHYKQDAWEEIVRTLSTNGTADISKTEMRELEVQLQKKWKSFRDCYIKILKNPNRQRRPYIYTKQLSFLKPISSRSKPVEMRSEDEFSHSEEETVKTKKRRRHHLVVKKERRRSSTASTDDETYLEMDNKAPEDSDESSNQQSQSHNPNTSARKPDHFMFANVDVPNETNDCDKLFLLSMLPYLKSIPDQYKLNVKMELMQVIQNAKSFNGDQNVI